MALLGKTITLAGVTQKGKNRIRHLGNCWMVFAETDHILFAPEKVGPWLYVCPLGSGFDDKNGRWIREFNDPDFQIVGRPVIDISDCPDLDNGFIEAVNIVAKGWVRLTQEELESIITANRCNMYKVGGSEVRKDSQFKVAAARYALALKSE
jgi:hypothetical protein